jgi:hypothetical protein
VGLKSLKSLNLTNVYPNNNNNNNKKNNKVKSKPLELRSRVKKYSFLKRDHGPLDFFLIFFIKYKKFSSILKIQCYF